jgi:general secretion pathway protein E
VQWLQADGVISPQESTRIVNRCAQAESAQHPLVRLAAVAVRRASDDKPMDMELLTQWLAVRTGLATCALTRSRSMSARWPTP